MWFSFDVESAGLFGQPFAVGWVLVDKSGVELEHGFHHCPVHDQTARGWRTDPLGEVWVSANVVPALDQPEDCPNLEFLCKKFWADWDACRARFPTVRMVTDCPFPVESGFLRACIDYLRLGMGDSPYPVIDVASVLLACGFDPMATYARLPQELPVHNPVADARQSLRIMVEAMNGVLVTLAP